jgi:hypothetical protein
VFWTDSPATVLLYGIYSVLATWQARFRFTSFFVVMSKRKEKEKKRAGANEYRLAFLTLLQSDLVWWSTKTLYQDH